MRIYSLEEACHAAWRGAFRGLRSQGWEQCGNKHGCVMRGPRGRSCAVGWLFKGGNELNKAASARELLLRGFEMAWPLQSWWRYVARGTDHQRFLDFLSKMQTIHDSFPSSADIEEEFKLLGESRGWEEPSL